MLVQSTYVVKFAAETKHTQYATQETNPKYKLEEKDYKSPGGYWGIINSWLRITGERCS